MLDTGIRADESVFGDRVRWGFDAVDETPAKTDLNGHGSTVAGVSPPV